MTPTASGKTLCYNLPVLNLLLREPEARAMYLFPTKALAEDQLHGFQALADELAAEIRAFTYDGDTPQDARKAIRSRANVVFTNPDMLHSGILPHHTRWAKVFENLRYIVIDELHYYRGVYGSHLANILRRLRAHLLVLRRVRRSLSARRRPSRIHASSRKRWRKRRLRWSIATALRRAKSISSSTIRRWSTGTWESGAATSMRSRRVAVELIERGQQTLVFANNRLATEILITYLRDACGARPRCRMKAFAAIAPVICRASAARSSAGCATAKFAAWWRRMRSNWGSISGRSTPW